MGPCSFFATYYVSPKASYFMTEPQFPHLYTGDDKISWGYED